MNRQASRAELSSRTVIPIDLCSWIGAIARRPVRVLNYQARPMLPTSSAAISQCSVIATAL